MKTRKDRKMFPGLLAQYKAQEERIKSCGQLAAEAHNRPYATTIGTMMSKDSVSCLTGKAMHNLAAYYEMHDDIEMRRLLGDKNNYFYDIIRPRALSFQLPVGKAFFTSTVEESSNENLKNIWNENNAPHPTLHRMFRQFTTSQFNEENNQNI